MLARRDHSRAGSPGRSSGGSVGTDTPVKRTVGRACVVWLPVALDHGSLIEATLRETRARVREREVRRKGEGLRHWDGEVASLECVVEPEIIELDHAGVASRTRSTNGLSASMNIDWQPEWLRVNSSLARLIAT
jgi:hypothetical protein